MEPGAVSRPPLATRPPTQPTQMLTRTRASLDPDELDTGIASGFDVSTGSAAAPLDSRPPVTLERLTTPYLLSAYATRPRPTRKIRIQPPFSIFTATPHLRAGS